MYAKACSCQACGCNLLVTCSQLLPNKKLYTIMKPNKILEVME